MSKTETKEFQFDNRLMNKIYYVKKFITTKRLKNISFYLILIIFCSILFTINYCNTKGKLNYPFIPNHLGELKNSDSFSIQDKNNWWNVSYNYRIPINISNKDLLPLPKGYSINISLNTINLISTGRLRADGKDLRVVWYNSSDDTLLELDRINETKFNLINTQIWFKTQASIEPWANDNNYYLYYGYKDANDPPTDKNKIFDYYEDFTQPDGPAEGWTQTMGSSWTVINNEYRENEGITNRRSILNSYTVENASIDIRLKSSGGTSICLGLLFRYQNSNNLYVVVLGAWQSEVGLGKWVNGNLQQIAISTTNSSLLVYDRWYDLKLEALGSRYLIYLDGTLKINTTDTDHLSAGQVGLITWTTSSTSYFDDLKIKLLVHKAPTVFLGIEETQHILNNWWDTSYKFRTPIQIINRDLVPLPKGYSINISVNTIHLISTRRLREDGKDLRVVWYNSSDDTWLELDRINETRFKSNDTKICFKTQTSIDPEEIDHNYYLYYGYEDASDPPTNKRKIYDYYDDFTQPDGPAEGWTQTMGSSWTVINNEYRENEGVNNRRTIVNSYSVGNASIEIRLKNSGGTNFGLGIIFRYLDSDDLYAIALGGWNREIGFGKWVAGSLSQVAITSTNQDVLVPDQWYNFKLDMLGSQYLIYLDGTLKINTTDTDHLSVGQFGLITYTTSTISYFDDLKIKLLVSKVPSASLGLEETQSISTTNWWNVSYVYRKPLYIVNNHSKPIPEDYSINVSFDTKKLISAGKLQSDGSDFRITWYDLSNNKWLELDRINQTMFNLNDTQIWFKTQEPIYPKTRDSNYYIYYGFEDANNPPTNKSKIYHYFDDFTQPDGPAEGWTNTNGSSWFVVNNEYRENDFIIDRRSILDLYTVENASIEINLKSSGGNFGAGVIFRYINENNFYTAGIGFWEYETAIGKWFNGEPSILYNTTDGENVLVDDQWYNLRIDALGSSYLVYLDGELKSMIIDTDLITSGQIGLMTWTTSAISYFDNLKIKLLITNLPISTIGNEETYRPQFNYIIESEDPLELGEIEILTVNVTDFSGIRQNLIEIDDAIYSMNYLGDDLWQYDSWVPLNTGNQIYKIHCQNNNLKWNSITESISVIDTTSPSYSNLIESADPLELGATEVIEINIFDLSGINQVLIELEGANHTMTNVGGNTWQYDAWTPSSTGNYPYTIHMEDLANNKNSVTNTITVSDTTPPSYSNLVESADPLELGETEIIEIDIFDISGINQVLIEIEEINYTMTNIGGDTWQYDAWTPSSTGTYSYTIYMEDMNSNLNSIADSITIVSSTPPTYSDLVESDDPLELGATEVISINVYDDSGINQVLIEIEGANYTMSNIGGDTWRYDAWTPSNTGNYPYTIHMEDLDNNWNSVSNSIEVVDTTPPSYSNLVESADPLELGATEIIEIDVFDISGINQILIELEGINYTMTNVGGDTWQYDIWTPSSTGSYSYTIYMEDLDNNWNSVSESIEVVDTFPPSYSDLVESEDPLELGLTEIISINVYDASEINQVLIEIEGINYTMANIGGDTWQHDTWTPLSTGTYPYTIFMEDLDNNWNSVSDSIEVVDTTPPSYSNLVESADPLELGATEIIEIDIFDLSGINQVLIEIEGINYTMVNIGGDTYQHDTWTPSSTGAYPYTIYIKDMNANWNSISDSITVMDTTPPEIIIYEPDPYDKFGINPPEMIIEIFDYDLDAVWYQLTDGSLPGNYTWFGYIDDNIWELFGTGLVTINFFANDSTGNLGSASIIISKDITAPDITINYPNPYDIFGKIAPNVDIEIEAEDLESIWYILFNSTQSITDYSWTDSIEQFIWDEFNSGILTIRFYANDTLGNIRFLDITIIKDVAPPVLIFYEPKPYNLYGASPPIIDIFIFDDNLDAVWYQLSNGLETTENHSWAGSITQDVWSELGNGTVKIIFYANDTLTNFATQSVTIRKDIIVPLIIINYPSNDTVYGNTPPNIGLNVDEPNIDNTWYQIDNGTITTGNYSWTGIIEKSVWDELGNGTLTIIFFSNDTVGNLGSKILIIRKDIIAPKIVIEKPSPNELFGESTPIIDVEFHDPHLSHMWYQLKNGTETTINYTWTGSIEQNIWNIFGNGSIIIIFYANDSLGNLGIEFLQIHKDVIAPKIIFDYPNPYDVFGKIAPNIDVIIDDNNLNNTWYQLKNESFTSLNYTWTGTLDQTVWDELGNGTVTIIFYANDLMGNFGYAEITILKDISAPIINIIEPENFTIFGQTPPGFKVYISGVDIHNCWYTLVGNKYFFTRSDGITIITINQTKWDEFGNGTLIIEFYVNDSVGNIGFDIVELRKDIFAPEVKINLPIFEGYWNKPPIINISYTDPNYDSLWYRIGSTNIVLINNTEQLIDPVIWNNLEQGEFHLHIFANDTAGNINNTFSYTLFKDTIAPSININLPLNNTYSNVPPTFNITCYDPNFDTLWYGDGNNNISLTNNTNQLLDWAIWNNLTDGKYQLIIYANDTFGHLNNYFILTLYKDTTAPEVTIYLPYNNTIYNQPPFLDIYAIDPNLHSLWYQIGEFSSVLQNHMGQTIDQAIWNVLPQGEFQLYIYANDSFGHLNDSITLTLYKDTLAPRIVLNFPYNETYWNSRPIINITAYDPNLDKIWYKIGTIYSWLENNTETLISDYIWSNLPEGQFIIEVYANDYLGHINDTYKLILYKDTSAPEITIYTPINNTLYNQPPILDIHVFEPNLHTLWYEIGEFTGILQNHIGQEIDQIIWNNLPQGEFQLRIYANDSFGYLNNTLILKLYKDTLAPNIIINLPIEYQEVGEIAPYFNLTIIEENLDTQWYTLDGGLSNYTFISNTQQIDQELWNSVWRSSSDGDIIVITFYANDTLDQLGSNEVIIWIKKPSENFKLIDRTGFIFTGTMGGVFGITMITIKTNKKFKRMNQKQKKKVNAIFYLTLTLISLVLLSFFI